MMRNKHKKPAFFRCFAEHIWPFSTIAWCLVGILLFLNLYAFVGKKHEHENPQVHVFRHSLIRELEAVEEGIRVSYPTGRRSPRAVKRKPRKITSLLDEFLDEHSRMRNLFFPDIKTAIDPRRNTGNDSSFYFPGRVWLDTEGNPIQAHGGGILFDEGSKTYYWYGEYKDGPTYRTYEDGVARVDIIGVGCYSSKDLWAWENVGLVLEADKTNTSHDLYKSNVLERPKVIHNHKTGKYIMYMHIDDVNYTKALVGVATGDYPSGPFTYLGSFRPHGCDSRDMTLFKDDDGTAYLIYSSENNSVLYISPLTEDYLQVTPIMRRVLVGQHREAPAVFKHQGVYYMITSGCTGWLPNEALAHTAESITGPWETMGNPCVGGNRYFRLATFFSQGTFVVPLDPHSGLFIFMADRWNPADLRDSRYVWLPLIIGGLRDDPLRYNFGFPVWPRVSIYWHKRWRLPSRWTVF